MTRLRRAGRWVACRYDNVFVWLVIAGMYAMTGARRSGDARLIDYAVGVLILVACTAIMEQRRNTQRLLDEFDERFAGVNAAANRSIRLAAIPAPEAGPSIADRIADHWKESR